MSKLLWSELDISPGNQMEFSDNGYVIKSAKHVVISKGYSEKVTTGIIIKPPEPICVFFSSPDIHIKYPMRYLRTGECYEIVLEMANHNDQAHYEIKPGYVIAYMVLLNPYVKRMFKVSRKIMEEIH